MTPTGKIYGTQEYMTGLRSEPDLRCDSPDPESPRAKEIHPASDESLELPEFLLSQRDEAPVRVAVPKETATTRIGISLRADMPSRAVVHKVADNSPGAEALIEPYDELISIGGVEPTSAVHAVKLIRDAPEGKLEIEKLPCPERLKRATSAAQGALRSAVARREGLTRRVMVKPTQDVALGLSFSPEWAVHSVVRSVRDGSIAGTALKEGDCIQRLNGMVCTSPAVTARALRSSSGRIELLIVPQYRQDRETMLEVEEVARAEEAESQRAEEDARRAEELARSPRSPRSPGGDYDDEEEYESGEEEEEELAAAMPPRGANLGMDPFPSPSRPTNVQVPTGGARRLPASLASLSPSGGVDSPQSPRLPAMKTGGVVLGQTSSTRARGPPLAAGAKPQGWREWLQQRRAMAATVTVPSPDPALTNQRV